MGCGVEKHIPYSLYKQVLPPSLKPEPRKRRVSFPNPLHMGPEDLQEDSKNVSLKMGRKTLSSG